MSKHTAGPWEIHDGGRFGQYSDIGPSICAVTGEGLCQPLFEIVGPRNAEECQANADLIAAAPELLEALRHMLHSVDYEQKIEAYNMAYTAIAKAEGRE